MNVELIILKKIKHFKKLKFKKKTIKKNKKSFQQNAQI